MFSSRFGKKVIKTVFSACFAAMLAVLPAKAETYRFVSFEYPPLIYTKDGKPGGLAYEIVEEAMKRSGNDFTMDLQSWSRSLKEIEEGTADGIFTIYVTEERSKFMDFTSEVLVPQQVSMFVSKTGGLTEDKIGYKGDPSVFKKYKIGLQRKINYGDALTKMIDGNEFAEVQVADSPEANILKLIGGRVDMVPSNSYTMWHNAKVSGKQDEITELMPPVEKVDSFVGLSKKRNLGKLKEQLDKALGEMKKDGTYDKIMARYANDPKKEEKKQQ
jgi:polar amino acid transport system substrate-binding protein